MGSIQLLDSVVKYRLALTSAPGERIEGFLNGFLKKPGSMKRPAIDLSANDWEAIEQTLARLTRSEKVQLVQRLTRSLRPATSKFSAEQRRDALNRLRKEIAELPVNNPADGFSNRDHDRVLYRDASSQYC